jgi:hypothetical protein
LKPAIRFSACWIERALEPIAFPLERSSHRACCNNGNHVGHVE